MRDTCTPMYILSVSEPEECYFKHGILSKSHKKIVTCLHYAHKIESFLRYNCCFIVEDPLKDRKGFMIILFMVHIHQQLANTLQAQSKSGHNEECLFVI